MLGKQRARCANLIYISQHSGARGLTQERHGRQGSAGISAVKLCEFGQLCMPTASGRSGAIALKLEGS